MECVPRFFVANGVRDAIGNDALYEYEEQRQIRQQVQ